MYVKPHILQPHNIPHIYLCALTIYHILLIFIITEKAQLPHAISSRWNNRDQ